MEHNILLIQANPQSAEVIRTALQMSQDTSFHVEYMNTLADGLSRLAQYAPTMSANSTISAIIVDLALPDITGFNIIEQLIAAAPLVPILVVASEMEEEMARVAVQRGAYDYFLTPRVDKYFFPKAVARMISQAAASASLFNEKEAVQLTLDSIGDAVISTNLAGDLIYLNGVAERLTGWTRADAIGRSLPEVIRIVDTDTRLPLPDPMLRATQDNHMIVLPPSCILIRRDGTEVAIEDSCAPIHDRLKHVTGAVMVFHDVSATRAVTSHLAYLAQHDSLTDLPNRVFLQNRLTQAIMMAQRHRTALAVLYLDLDRFKQVNDSLGHPVGDRLLQSVALRLSQCVRASDTVSRQGGDEFVILLPDIVQAEDAVVCAQKVIQALKLPHLIDEHELHVTASVGIVIYPEDGTDSEALLENADSAMYEAKEGGRNIYRFYRSDVNAKAIERQALETGLRLALNRHEFELHYQPVVNLATGAVSGAEALIRWQHPVLGFLLPAQFMSIAEESGLIVPIGQWVLRKACHQAKLWQSMSSSELRLAVNISAVELRSKDFLASVMIILKETGFNPARLDLELTETFLMQDTKSTLLVLQAIKELGVQLALDDFGTGYSSLSYMRRFPIDVLKIDRSFVGNLTLDVDDASVVSAIINMGESLHMRVVAEGVETEQQLLFLQDHDCAEAQGYCFSRPVSAEEFGALLRFPTPLAGKSKSLVNAHQQLDGIGPTAGLTRMSPRLDKGRSANAYPVPINEDDRLAELYRYKILDTPPEEIFDRITRFAAESCEVPIALISLVDRDRQWFKSHYGLDVSETPREHAFCAHTILGSEPLIVANARGDPRFARNVLVREEPGIRFYAAVPLITSRGFAIGSLCIIDRRPRRLTDAKLVTLKTLAAQVVQQIELREVAETLRQRSLLLDKVQQTARIGGWEIDLRTNALTWTEETYRIHGLAPDDYSPTVESAMNFYAPEAIPVIRQALRAAIGAAVQFDVELKIVFADGEHKWVRALGGREDEDGEPRRVIGVLQDINEVRRLENEIVHIAQREQTRIGLDLHDGLGQELTGIAFMMGSVLAAVPTNAGSLRADLGQIEGLMRGAIGTCATVARGLWPTGRDRRGLIGAIRQLVARIEKLHRVSIQFHTQGRAWSLDSTVADHLYRIVQESISNAIKHGPAHPIEVSVEWNVDRALIAITNDGREEVAKERSEGMGLEIMRYRARLIGATLGINRTTSGGTRIRCHFPHSSLERFTPNLEKPLLDSDQRWR